MFSINTNPAYSIAFSYTKILKPTLVNEFRYGFIRQLVNLHELTDIPLSDLTAKYGIKGIPGNSSLFGLPEFLFNGGIGFTGLGETGSMPNFKIHRYTNIWTISPGIMATTISSSVRTCTGSAATSWAATPRTSNFSSMVNSRASAWRTFC